MKIIDSKTAAPYVRPSIFLHGLTGKGKSTWATAGGRPLVILTEAKAASLLRQINPDAVGLVPESLDDLDNLFQILGDADRMAARQVDRIVLDSYTELTMAMPRWIMARAGRSTAAVSARLDLQEYGDLGSYAHAVVKAIQLTGLPSVIIARSTSKKMGREEMVVPDGTGKSVDGLPGKLLPTAEARFDSDHGYVIDTTPSEYSQRCGLPWVPQVFAGTCLEYLALVEKNQPAPVAPTPEPAPAPAPAKAKAKPAPAPAPKPEPLPPEPPAEFVDAIHALNIKLEAMGADPTKRAEEVQLWMNRGPECLELLKTTIVALDAPAPQRVDAPDPETQPAEYRAAFGEVCADQAADKKAATKEARDSAPDPVEEFVAGVEVGQPNVRFVTADEAGEIQALVLQYKLPDPELRAYCVSRDRIVPFKDGSTSWLRLREDSHAPLMTALKTENGRRAMVAAASTFKKEA